MRIRVKVASPEIELSRFLESMEQDLLNATDEEILLVAKDLGMNLAQRESAAFAGLKYPAKPQLADFFDFAICKKAIDKAQPIVNYSPEESNQGRFMFVDEKKNSSDK